MPEFGRIAPIVSESTDAQPLCNQFETVGRLHDGHAHESGPVGTVELSRRNQCATLSRESVHEGPRVAVRSRSPQIESTSGHRRIDPDGCEDLTEPFEPGAIAIALFHNMLLIAPCGHRRRLDRTGNHETGVLSQFGQISDEIAVTGVETCPHPCQIRSLRERVHGQHAIGAVFEDRRSGAGPRELDVALVGDDRDSVRTSPRRGGTEIVKVSGGIAR